MAGGFRSLFALWIGGASKSPAQQGGFLTLLGPLGGTLPSGQQAGFRTLLGPLGGTSPAGVQAGFQSMLAMWMGGNVGVGTGIPGADNLNQRGIFRRLGAYN